MKSCCRSFTFKKLEVRSESDTPKEGSKRKLREGSMQTTNNRNKRKWKTSNPSSFCPFNMDQQAKEELLKQIYYDPKTGLSSAMEVKWLKKETNQIFQPTDKAKIIYPPIIGRTNGEYQADLMFLTQYKTKNSGHSHTSSRKNKETRLLIISRNSFRNPVIAKTVSQWF